MNGMMYCPEALSDAAIVNPDAENQENAHPNWTESVVWARHKMLSAFGFNGKCFRVQWKVHWPHGLKWQFQTIMRYKKSIRRKTQH